MNLTPPLYFLAIAVALLSSHVTQVYAQAPDSTAGCEEFTAAIEAMGDATIQTVTVDEVFTPEVVEQIEEIEEGLVTVQTDAFSAVIDLSIDQVVSLEPNSELGDVCGFCFSVVSGFEPFVPFVLLFPTPLEDIIAPVRAEVFDGDTSIGFVRPPVDSREGDSNEFSFIAGPGEKITRVELRAGLNSTFVEFTFADFSFAFKPPVSQQDPLSPAEAILDFEDVSGFTVINGSSDIRASDVASSGQTSLEVEGAGYSVIQSPELSTADLLPGATEVSVDLFIGSNQPNRYWVGAVQFYVHAPSAHLFNAYVGQIELTGLAQDEFSTLTFDLPQFISQRLNGSFDDVQLRFALNVNRGSGPYFFDNIQFAE